MMDLAATDEAALDEATLDETVDPGAGLARVGVRELRNDIAAVLRRAGAGERLVVTVDGQPIAQLGPLHPTGAPTLDDLAATGAVRLPRGRPRVDPPEPVALPIDQRVDAVVAELRGEDVRRR